MDGLQSCSKQELPKVRLRMLESFDFLSKGNSKLIKLQSLYDKGMGMVLLHGFCCRVYSWHRVMPSFCPATCSLNPAVSIMRLPLSFLFCVILTFRMGLQGPLHVEGWDVSIHLKCRISGILQVLNQKPF